MDYLDQRSGKDWRGWYSFFVKVLFVCTGNICRSPMAEAVLRHVAKERGLNLEVDSAGLTSYHLGEAADERGVEELRKNGIDYAGRARLVRREDFFDFDHILVMTDGHLAEMKKIRPDGATAQVKKLLDYSVEHEGDVPDPYYNDGFESVFRMVKSGVEGLVEKHR